jgi:anoctamin-10
MFAYTVTNQVVDTLTEIVLPYVRRGVVEVKNGKGIGGLRAHKKKVVFDDDKTGPVEERKFLDEIRRNIALPDYSLFGTCHLN